MNTSKAAARRYAPFVLALLVAALDRATKIAARGSVDAQIGIPVIPGFLRFFHTENPGAAFSFLSEGNPVLRSIVLIGVSSAVLLFVVWTLWRSQPGWATPLIRSGLGLVLGGAAGNLFDRVFRGTVTDFIEVYHGGWSFPVFNVADSAITAGAGLLLIDMLFVNAHK